MANTSPADRKDLAMADLYDLNAIRDSFYAQQRAGAEAPTVPDQQVYVDKTGRVQLGTGNGPTRELSRVPAGTFAARDADTRRLAEERKVVRAKLPRGTYYETRPGAEGWVYEIVTEFNHHYTMCAHFTGTGYQVRLLEPELESLPQHDEHGMHLYTSGKICLSTSPGSGERTLEDAYSRSAVWALGMDFVRQHRAFPFNYNQ
jgi:hypothetical protein